MKRTTYLKIMGIGWCLPQFLIMAPFALVAIVCGYTADFFVWVEGKTAALSAKVGTALYPPAWWPSHRYLSELEEIRAAKRKEAIDRLHANASKRKALSPSGEGEGGEASE